jgi:hypothetical protein
MTVAENKDGGLDRCLLAETFGRLAGAPGISCRNAAAVPGVGLLLEVKSKRFTCPDPGPCSALSPKGRGSFSQIEPT